MFFLSPRVILISLRLIKLPLFYLRKMSLISYFFRLLLALFSIVISNIFSSKKIKTKSNKYKRNIIIIFCVFFKSLISYFL